MSLNKFIIDTLKPLNVPVSFGKYNQTADTYVVFLEYKQDGALFADDEEKKTEHIFQVDVFSKGNYLELVKKMKYLLKSVGFRRTFETETYEEEMKRFRKILRFTYISKEEQ